MDPYLESPDNWRSFHHNFATELARQLNPLITPKYFADVEVHTVLEETGISMQYATYPDTAVFEINPESAHQPSTSTVATPVAPVERLIDLSEPFKLRTVHVKDTDERRIVTSIEILSPANKIGEGLRLYRQKRLRLLCSDVHLLELDLLRRGERPGSELMEPAIAEEYVVLLSRVSGTSTRRAEIWPVGLNQTLPEVPVPLLPPDQDVVINLQRAMTQVYADFSYEYRIDYSRPIPPPKLRPEIQTWLKKRDSS